MPKNIQITTALPFQKKYRSISKKGEGTFSEVLKCQNIATAKHYAVKRMKNKFHTIDQVNNFREVQALRKLNPHKNIIHLEEVIFDKEKKTLDLVCELMEMNIYERIRGRKKFLSEDIVRGYIYSLCKALDHMHRNGIFHRDVKPENVLIRGDDTLKLADLGSCRGIYAKQPFTEYISTRWYRAPECLLTDGYYSFKMDMWSVGCVMFEIIALFPLFPGSNEVDQIGKIHDILGTPSPTVLAKIRKNSPHMKFNFPHKDPKGIAQLIPHASPECIDLIEQLCCYDPDQRYSARQAIRHPYFKDLRDADRRARQALKQAQKKDKMPHSLGETMSETMLRTHKPHKQKRSSDRDSNGGLQPIDKHVRQTHRKAHKKMLQAKMDLPPLLLGNKKTKKQTKVATNRSGRHIQGSKSFSSSHYQLPAIAKRQ